MDRIENWIIKKYLDEDYDRYIKYMSLYLKIKDAMSFIPETIVNTYLCIRFPFLKYSRNRKKFFQRNCWYWRIECGWRKAFGIQLCKELKAALNRGGMLKTWEITDIKEKYGAHTVAFASKTGPEQTFLKAVEILFTLKKQNY